MRKRKLTKEEQVLKLIARCGRVCRDGSRVEGFETGTRLRKSVVRGNDALTTLVADGRVRAISTARPLDTQWFEIAVGKPLVDVFTVKRDALVRMAAINSRDLPHLIEDGGRRKRWVGIGWVDEGPADGTEVLVVD